MSGNRDESAAFKERDSSLTFPFRHMESCRKIVVAAVNGACHAGGLKILMHSDVSVAADSAVFRGPELLRGVPDPYMSGRLAQHVGLAKPKYMMFAAALVEAGEAESMGLVGRVVPGAEFDAEVERVLDQVRATAPKARAMIKADFNDRLPRHDYNMFKHSIMSPEMIEGMTAFMQKRAPDWPRE